MRKTLQVCNIGFYLKKFFKPLFKTIKQNNYDSINPYNCNASIAVWWHEMSYNVYTEHGLYFHYDQSKIARWATIQLERGLAKLTTYTLSQSQENVNSLLRHLISFKTENSKEQTIQSFKLIQEIYNDGAYINQVMSLKHITRNSHIS